MSRINMNDMKNGFADKDTVSPQEQLDEELESTLFKHRYNIDFSTEQAIQAIKEAFSRTVIGEDVEPNSSNYTLRRVQEGQNRLKKTERSVLFGSDK